MNREKAIREETVEKRLKRLCDRRGWICVKLDPSTAKGIPDRLVIAGGRVAFVETKRPKGGRLEPVQRHWQRKLADLGQRAYVAHTKEQVDAIVAELGEGEP